VTHEEKVALIYAIVYAVPVLGLAGLISFRLASKPNRTFRAFLPVVALSFATMVGIGLAVAAHYMGQA
jgi:hypothetical protein